MNEMRSRLSKVEVAEKENETTSVVDTIMDSEFDPNATIESESLAQGDVISNNERGTVTPSTDKGVWGSNLAYLLMLVGYAVGFGNIWNDVNGRTSKYYWNRVTLSISKGIDYPGDYNGLLVLYHLITWLAIYIILWKGMKFAGKVVYFTAVFPYVVLMAFFIANFAIEPEKAWLGAYRLLKPDWTTLTSPLVWLKAGSQVFYSLGLACGCLVVFGSYNQPRNDVHKDAVYISIISGITSVFASLVVFPIIGALGHRKYEECVADMKIIFPNLKYLSDEDKYDIYFTTTANKWGDVSPIHPIIVRYGYGELLDENKKNLDYYRDQEIFEQISSLSDVSMTNRSLHLTLRDCSIGKEATAV
ncbi:unnamed protein product [Orchesella dallaii]|uniref:Uncharacterized protein n=1 Tax=Orchesella dallaii TaxID=48710 RepID=A0ABP1QJ04_9HEXA